MTIHMPIVPAKAGIQSILPLLLDEHQKTGSGLSSGCSELIKSLDFYNPAHPAVERGPRFSTNLSHERSLDTALRRYERV